MKQRIRTRDVLLDVWREACRHVEIHEATARIADVLAPHAPLSRVIVRRINLPTSCVETVAAGAAAQGRSIRLARTDCSAAQMKSIVSWCRAGLPIQGDRTSLPAALRRLVPADVSGEAWIGPLSSAGEPSGVLILTAQEGRRFSAGDVELLADLIEPFSAALENDHRLHEMAQLRERAEADRRALLAKLGRRDVAAPIVGIDAGLRAVMERVATVAGSGVPVILFGETGSGKEVIARAIHNQSPCAAGPFIRVNCGAIPPELTDSQLFGHEKGSFTGASETRKGWFERADGGTLFLDEIGDLPPAAQVRLLRVLEDGALERVGGQHPIHVDVRIIGATHRDLAAMVRAGAFREDLWHRLVVFPISIPPLRDRAEDIGPLACHFAEKAATRFGLALAMPTVEDIRLLTRYAWPGNVRELASVIDRAALLGNGRRLEIATALGAVPSPNGASASPPPAPGDPAAAVGRTLPPDAAAPTPPPTDGPLTLDSAMRMHIETALRLSRGRVEGPFGAAARLHINANTLRARMRKLHIEWRRFRAPT